MRSKHVKNISQSNEYMYPSRICISMGCVMGIFMLKPSSCCHGTQKLTPWESVKLRYHELIKTNHKPDAIHCPVGSTAMHLTTPVWPLYTYKENKSEFHPFTASLNNYHVHNTALCKEPFNGSCNGF